MSTPIVPPRPTRANGTTTAIGGSMPQVPPRPVRKTDPSPSRDFRSPLNELPNPMGGVTKRTSRSNLSASDLPPRPPSVSSFPSVGQEGVEYSSYDLLPPPVPGVTNAATASELGTPETTRNVARDMPLHAPKASVPQSTAKSRIETVTGTDSVSAAAAGIGKARPDDDVHKTPADSSTSLGEPKGEDLRRVASAHRPSPRPPSSGTPHGTSRPASVYDDDHEHGIPQIGQQIPLYKNAGDVQAPSFGATMSQHTPGVGFFNDGSSRAHQRRRSARSDFAPPGSYGLHSHGVEPHDQFERDWYAKHPDKALLEGSSAYGRSRPETALSSEQLNRIVTQTDEPGMGTEATAIGTPGEEIAWGASDAYIARHSPRPSPAPTRERTKRPSSGSQPAVESPLRRTSFTASHGDHAIDDDGAIHVNQPEYRVSKYNGGGPADGAEDLGPEAGNTAEAGGWWVERGDGTPILASDEVLKRRESAYMQPAVNPEYHYDEYEQEYMHDASRRNSTRVPSRPSSRHGSVVHEYTGGNLHRFISHEEPHHGSGHHTPLEEIEEYEPLIPEGEEDSPRTKLREKEVKKRPGLEHHHFPSQDVWEDTPSSLQFSTTVSTPDVDRETVAAAPPTHFETPEQEQKRKTLNPADLSSDQKTLLKPHYASLAADRPGVQRFPSRDIWEDTPSSLQYSTTVGGPQMDESRGEPDDRPTTNAIPGSQDDGEARSTTGLTSGLRPSLPARPKQRSKLAEEVKPGELSEQSPEESRDIDDAAPSSPEKGKAPPIPDRSKPTVPARPVRSAKTDQSDDLTQTTSQDSQGSTDTVTSPPPPTKSKPAVPTRVGDKIAALKAGFMTDLNNRLKVGPSAPPSKSRDLEPEEEEAEKAPLADARKSRARGPARRKPASSPSAAAAEDPSSFSFSMSNMHTMWAIDESEELSVPTTAPAAADASEASTSQLEKVLSDNTASNTVEPGRAESLSLGSSTSPPPTSSTAATGVAALSSSPEENKSLQAKLEASLAEVGAGPAVSSSQGTEDLKDVVGTERTSADKAVEEQGAVDVQ